MWTPVGVVDSRELAEVMAVVLQEEVGTEARALSSYELLHRLRAEDRERIFDRLHDRTTADIERDLELRWTAAGRLTSMSERRSGRDRRSGHDRRSRRQPSASGGERRSGHDRRSGRDRRRVQTAT